jgi:uncharacterized protein YaiI (UPF0178 family)
MDIWVDADACPAAVKDILYRMAERLQLNVTLVANQLMRVPGSRFIRALQGERRSRERNRARTRPTRKSSRACSPATSSSRATSPSPPSCWTRAACR